MGINKWLKSLGLVAGVLSLYSTAVLADEVSNDEVQELPEIVVTVPNEETLTESDEVVEEEAPEESDDVVSDEDISIESEEVVIDEETSADLEKVTSDKEALMEPEEVLVDEELPSESEELPKEEESTELENLKKYTNESILNWFKEGLITQEEYDKITTDILNATTSDEIDVLFTTFYDEVIVPPVLVIEEIIKGYEDEIASWVTEGYIDQEGELLLLELLNSLDSIEEMDEFMVILRELLAELDDLDEEDDDVVVIEEEIEPEDKSKPTYELINTNQNNKPKNNVTNVTYKASTKNQESLPKTGEEQNVAVAFAGMMMMALFSRVYLRKQDEL